MIGGALVGASGADAFPGDNGALVFSSNRIGPEDVAVPPATEPTADFDIFITGPDGSAVNLTANNVSLVVPEGGGDPVPTPINDLHPVVSPDGTKIAFTSNRPSADPADAGSTDPDLYIMNIDGTGLVQLTTNKPGQGGAMGAAEYEPAWSPDGTKIAYREGDGVNADLWIIDIATKTTKRLTGLTGTGSGPAGYDAEPAWSPDGTRIAYANGKGPTVKIEVVDVATGVISTLIDEPGVSDASPSWSPDGTQIAFRRGDEGAGAGIWRVPVAGGPATQLTDPLTDLAPTADEPAAYSDLLPSWSPDGTLIAFESTRPDEGETVAGDGDIYTMDTDGNNLTRIPASAVFPAVGTTAHGEPGGDGGAPDPADTDTQPDWQTIPRIAPPPATGAGGLAACTPDIKQPAAPVVKPPTGTFALTREQLVINQRISSAAVRRANSVMDKLQAGLTGTDFQDCSVGADRWPSALLAAISAGEPAGPATPAEGARPVPTRTPGEGEAGDIALTREQLIINQRISAAAVRRINAITARLDGGLTAGDFRNGSIQAITLDSTGRSTFASALPSAGDVSSAFVPLDITRKNPEDLKSVRVTRAQLVINQRISSAAVRRINAVRAQFDVGLTGANIMPGGLSRSTLAPAIQLGQK